VNTKLTSQLCTILVTSETIKSLSQDNIVYSLVWGLSDCFCFVRLALSTQLLAKETKVTPASTTIETVHHNNVSGG